MGVEQLNTSAQNVGKSARVMNYKPEEEHAVSEFKLTAQEIAESNDPMFDQEGKDDDDRDVARLKYLGSTKVMVDTIIEKSMLDVVAPKSEDDDHPAPLANNYRNICESEYDCIRNVIYYQERYQWARAKDSKAEMNQDQNEPVPVIP